MLIALTTYLVATPHLPPDPLFADAKSADAQRPMNRQEWHAVIALLLLFLPTSLFWATYEQQGNTIALWAADRTDRTVNLIFWSAEIPITWFQAFNPFMIFAFTPFVVALWARQAQRGTEPSPVVKMALGCAGCGISYLILATAAVYAGSAEASWLWLFAYFVVITTGELYLSPIGLSLVSKVAPVRHVSMMMGMWLGTSFTQFPGRLSRQLLVIDGKAVVLSNDCGNCLGGGCRDLGLRAAAPPGAPRRRSHPGSGLTIQ